MVDQGPGSRAVHPLLRTSARIFEMIWVNEAHPTVAGIKLSITSSSLAALVEKRLGIEARILLDDVGDDFLPWSQSACFYVWEIESYVNRTVHRDKVWTNVTAESHRDFDVANRETRNIAELRSSAARDAAAEDLVDFRCIRRPQSRR